MTGVLRQLSIRTETLDRTASLFRWLWFEFRANGLRLRRATSDVFNKRKFLAFRLPPSDRDRFPVVIAESVSRLWTAQSEAEAQLVSGKVHNLRLAAKHLDGTFISPGATFSFWSVVGRPSRRRGFVAGRELREGCLIANVGGGLCQLSNALYAAALDAGLEIVERHNHSRIIPGSQAEIGRDATVFWNYKDLRLRMLQPIVLEVLITPADLVVRLRAQTKFVHVRAHFGSGSVSGAAHDCLQCAVVGCIHHPGKLQRRS